MLHAAGILLVLAGLCYAQHPIVATEERHLRNPDRNHRVIFPGWEPNNFHDQPQRDSGQQYKSKAQLPDTLNLSDLSVSSLRMLGSMQNLSAIAEFFGLDPEPIEEPVFEAALSRGAHVDISLRGRSGAVSEPEEAKFAACSPSLQTVEFEAPEHTLYLPPCVSLERCGGCCAGADLLSCQPTQTTPVALKVIKIAKQQSMTSSRAGRRRPSRQTSNYHIIHEKKHTACTCQCIIQEKDCDLSIHKYKATDCACVCKKKDEESKCKSNSATHDWNSKTCKCTCRKVRGCSTGEYFDHNTCRCIRNRSRNAYSASSGGRIIETNDVPQSSEPKRYHRNYRRKPQKVHLPLL